MRAKATSWSHVVPTVHVRHKANRAWTCGILACPTTTAPLTHGHCHGPRVKQERGCLATSCSCPAPAGTASSVPLGMAGSKHGTKNLVCTCKQLRRANSQPAVKAPATTTQAAPPATDHGQSTEPFTKRGSQRPANRHPASARHSRKPAFLTRQFHFAVTHPFVRAPSAPQTPHCTGPRWLQRPLSGQTGPYA